MDTNSVSPDLAEGTGVKGWGHANKEGRVPEGNTVMGNCCSPPQE